MTCGGGQKRTTHFRIGLIFLMLATLLLAACGPKKDISSGSVKATQEHPFTRLAPPPQSSKEIQKLMELARVYNEIDMALTGLEELTRLAPPPINEEAAFRRVELMLEFQYPQAVAEAEQLLATYPMHALAPYAHTWLARWWISQNNDAQTLDAFIQVLKHPRLTRELAEEALNSATPVAQRAPEKEALQWLFTAAEIDINRQEHWLRAAANKASLESIMQVQRTQRLSPEMLKKFYLHAARIRLMSGQIDEVRAIAGILSTSMPNDAITRKVEAWASGITQHVTIGILLPLSGKYARYGDEALRGIRLAIASESYANTVDLRIADSESSSEGAIRGYQKLVSSGSEWVVGPLVSEHTAALLPHLVSHVPVISLSNQISLAEASPKLFIHSLAKSVQAAYMAEFAWQQGSRKVVVLSESSEASRDEAETFMATFEKLGGEIAEHLVLDDVTDNRPELQALREKTDDEELLAELDDDIALLSAETELEVRLPLNFDAIYVALPGKRVSVLAGQLAYVDISGVPMYGSSRWQDGHLLDDRGRYLSRSRFANVSFPVADNNTVRHMLRSYRETWGSGEPGKLFGMAYDSVLIAAVLGSRLGLSGRDAIQGLHDAEGFPGLTGHVRFDESGVGRKEFETFTIKRGELTPAG
ncbi:MAG TPA: penicillin-binding protein activator [Mariprofundaceae bacterium]|nr:penicillin-binding protein activator [Mariprofundaceae bacterium]